MNKLFPTILIGSVVYSKHGGNGIRVEEVHDGFITGREVDYVVNSVPPATDTDFRILSFKNIERW